VRFRALACDYDGTLAHDGVVTRTTAAALDRFLESGRQLFMVTGRELPDLQKVCSILDRFEWVIAENGALLHRPSTGETRLLCEPASPELVESLRRFDLSWLSVGQAVIATIEPNEIVVLEEIKRLGLELQVVFNKGSVMVLPAGVNKASGLIALLKEAGLSADEVVGVGDAENDHAFLARSRTRCRCSNSAPTS
jgi:hydroxymethylpyrimidine pyrophosphatase-like HAD family hydrolase